jgi:predicted MFS family arabinose efflux permease
MWFQTDEQVSDTLPRSGMLITGVVLLTGISLLVISMEAVRAPYIHSRSSSQQHTGALWDRNRRKAVISLACYFAGYAATGCLELVFTLFVLPLSDALQESPARVSAAATVHLMILAVTGPVWIGVSQKFGMRILFVIAAILQVTAVFGLFMLSNLSTLYASFACTGLAMATSYGASMMNAIAIMPPHLQSFASALIMMAYISGSLVFMYPTQMLIPVVGVHYTFLALGAVTAMILLACTFLLPREGDEISLRRHEVEARPKDVPQDMSGNYVVATILFMLVYGLCTFNCEIIEIEIRPLVETSQPIGSLATRLCGTVYLLASFASRIVWMLATLRKSALSMLALTCFLYSINAVALGHFSSGSVHATLASVVGVALTGSAMSALVPLGISRLFSQEVAARIYAWAIAGDVLGAMSPPLSSWLAWKLGWPTTLRASALLQLVPMAILLFALPRDVCEEANDWQHQGSDVKSSPIAEIRNSIGKKDDVDLEDCDTCHPSSSGNSDIGEVDLETTSLVSKCNSEQ